MTADPTLHERATELSAAAPEPAVTDNVLLGTAGWTDPSLVKSHLFYPRSAKTAQARLEHYARHFSLVEVDATYYTLLPPELSRRWSGFTPPTFSFDVKAHPVLTGHPIDVTRLPGDLRDAFGPDFEESRRVHRENVPAELVNEMERRFFDFCAPLRDAGRLGCILLQFPPWFGATRGNARAIEDVVTRFPDWPFAVEFRNRTWLEPERRDRVFELLHRIRATYVVVDEPDSAIGGVPPTLAVTNPELAVVRFHGHNAAGWRKGATVQERFDYLYSPEELSAWVSPVRDLSHEAKKVHAVFNNCVRNYAVLNAKGLAVLLGGEGESGPKRAKHEGSAKHTEAR